MITGRPADGEIVKRRHPNEIAARDRRFAATKREVPRQLRPVSSFERQIFASNHHAGLSEDRPSVRQVVEEILESPPSLRFLHPHKRIGEYLQREVMIAHHEFIARQLVERVLQLLRLRHREILGVAHATVLRRQDPLSGGFRQERETLGEHEGVRRRQ